VSGAEYQNSTEPRTIPIIWVMTRSLPEMTKDSIQDTLIKQVSKEVYWISWSAKNSSKNIDAKKEIKETPSSREFTTANSTI